MPFIFLEMVEMKKLSTHLPHIGWTVLVLMGIYLWIFDWGVGYVVLTIIMMGVSKVLSRHKHRQGRVFECVAIVVLLAVHFWAYQNLQAHKQTYDTGKSWSQYGAL